MRINCIIYLLLFCFFFSCKEKDEVGCLPVTSIDLSGADTLLIKQISIEEYLLSYPEAMILLNGQLVIQDRKGQSSLFHAVDVKSGQFTEFAYRGNGPEEYLDANLNPFVCEGNMVGFYDGIKRKVFFWEQIDNRFRFFQDVDFNCKDEWIRESVCCGDYFLLTGEKGRFSKSRFLIANNVGNVVSQSGKYPFISSSFFVNSGDDMRKLLYSSSFWRISPDKQKAIFASYHGSLCQFFDLSFLPDSLREIKSLQLTAPINFSQITKEHAGWVYGFEDVFVTNDYVYLVFNGQTALDNPGFGHYILVYDWNGSLVKTYVSDLGIRSIAVDEVQGIFYLVGYDGEEMMLYSALVDC